MCTNLYVHFVSEYSASNKLLSRSNLEIIYCGTGVFVMTEKREMKMQNRPFLTIMKMIKMEATADIMSE